MDKLRSLTPWVLIAAFVAVLPFAFNEFWVVIATRAAIYWILVAGLNLAVGFAGQLAIGYVALLTLGAYTSTILVQRFGLSPFLGLIAAAGVGGVAGVIVGLPALRLRTFYFAMATLGFATIVTQVALAWQSVTGGGIGLPGPEMPSPFDTLPVLLAIVFPSIVTVLVAAKVLINTPLVAAPAVPLFDTVPTLYVVLPFVPNSSKCTPLPVLVCTLFRNMVMSWFVPPAKV